MDIPKGAELVQIVAVQDKWMVCVDEDGSTWTARADVLVFYRHTRKHDQTSFLMSEYASVDEDFQDACIPITSEHHSGFVCVANAKSAEDAVRQSTALVEAYKLTDAFARLSKGGGK